MDDLGEFARLLIDRRRLAVLGHLAVAPATADELAQHTGIARPTIRRILGRLTASGLVTAEDGRLQLDEQVLRALAAAAAAPRPEPAAPHLFGHLDPGDADRAARYFQGTRLLALPGAGPKRTAVLQVLIDEFEPGRYYGEADVRRILRRFHADDAALRRFLVDEGLLLREPGGRTYWRGGGPSPDGEEVSRPLRS